MKNQMCDCTKQPTSLFKHEMCLKQMSYNGMVYCIALDHDFSRRFSFASACIALLCRPAKLKHQQVPAESEHHHRSKA